MAYLLDANIFIQAKNLHYGIAHEIASDGIKRVKIPTVCIGLKIKCIGPYQMLRNQRAKFVLDRRTA